MGMGFSAGADVHSSGAQSSYFKMPTREFFIRGEVVHESATIVDGRSADVKGGSNEVIYVVSMKPPNTTAEWTSTMVDSCTSSE
jgi:hypothetical protein